MNELLARVERPGIRASAEELLAELELIPSSSFHSEDHLLEAFQDPESTPEPFEVEVDHFNRSSTFYDLSSVNLQSASDNALAATSFLSSQSIYRGLVSHCLPDTTPHLIRPRFKRPLDPKAEPLFKHHIHHDSSY